MLWIQTPRGSNIVFSDSSAMVYEAQNQYSLHFSREETCSKSWDQSMAKTTPRYSASSQPACLLKRNIIISKLFLMFQSFFSLIKQSWEYLSSFLLLWIHFSSLESFKHCLLIIWPNKSKESWILLSPWWGIWNQ